MDLNEFLGVAARALGVDLDGASPHRALIEEGSTSLYIVAGPGTGKTTALALLVLKAMFLDGHPADSVVATTFTRKAAAELRSRITRGVVALLNATGKPLDDPAYDVSAIRVGTIDELSQAALVDLQGGVPVDRVVQNGTMRNTIFRSGFYASPAVRSAIVGVMQALFSGGQVPLPVLRDRLVTIRERIGHDSVDADDWASRRMGADRVVKLVREYEASLTQAGRMDFVGLEQQFLDFLLTDRLAAWLEPTRVLLLDEYQDTNLLQESIYRVISNWAISQSGWVALVGDDDQSLFRFRGATVDLFVEAQQRFGVPFKFVSLDINRRSTQSIVNFANTYVNLDPAYQPARVAGKGLLQGAPNRTTWKDSDALPVFSLFRPNRVILAAGIAGIIQELLQNRWSPTGGPALGVKQPGDIAVIGFTTQRTTSGGNARVYSYLETILDPLGIGWFNPRGTRLADVPIVRRLIGLSLLCLDPNGSLQPPQTPVDAGREFARWRATGTAFVAGNPVPSQPHRLEDFVDAWAARLPQGRARAWPRRFPLMELLHELSVWVPELRRSPGVLYLEGITRTLDELTTLLGPTGTLILRDKWDESVRRLYWNFFIPLALNEVELDEEVLGSLPLDAVNALTIHQAKGLEFPVCFVDVGSDFDRDHWAQRFRRFPDANRLTDPYSLEEDLRISSPLVPPARSRRDRAFDDLTRAYFVAFTRAQHIMVLFGLGSPENGPLAIPNVATGWTRDNSNQWSTLETTTI
jgi:DNA helicase II / ATP-dependent DNA helicase PcrA